MKKLLLIIDLQQAFINENTEYIINKISDLLDNNKYDEVAFTRFVNSYDNVCYKRLGWEDCISLESKKIKIDTYDKKIFDKETYTSLTDEFKNYIKENKIEKIYLCGIDTECCVLKTAYDLFENDYDVYVLKDYCACMDGIDSHNSALNILKRNIGEDRVI